MKTRTIQFRLSEEEYALISGRAGNHAMPIGMFVRNCCLGLLNHREPGQDGIERKGVVKKSDQKSETLVEKSARVDGMAIVRSSVDLHLKPGESVDQWGNKRSLAKPGGKKK